MSLNQSLITAAYKKLGINKEAFVPSDATAGGAPQDPSAGGAPPDPSGGAGAPPPDPSAGGAPPDPSAGGAPPTPPDASGGGSAAEIAQGVTQALMASGVVGGGKGGVGPSGKPTMKPDINTIATDVFQLKKLILNLFRRQGFELPQEILDGPNRDPVTGAPLESPQGGSDVQPQTQPQGPGSSIQGIQPMQGAFPSGGGDQGGGMGKMSYIGEEIKGVNVISRAAAVARMLKRR